MGNPVVSVCLITYNHEKYVRQALQSILSQKHKFDWEIIVADDRSTDNTRGILLEFYEQHPNLIKLILQDENVGPGRNFTQLIESAAGKYIAYLEGDDYWTDEEKLEKQVGFLEGHTDYVICYHPVWLLKDNGKLEPEMLNVQGEEKTYDCYDLAKGNFIHSPSLVFKNRAYGKLPEWYSKVPVGDYVLHMLNARHGKIFCMAQAMAVYRIHDAGVWSKKSQMFQSKSCVQMLELLIPEFGDNLKVKNLLEKQLAVACNWLEDYNLKEGETGEASTYFLKSLNANNENFGVWYREVYLSEKAELRGLRANLWNKMLRAGKHPIRTFWKVIDRAKPH